MDATRARRLVQETFQQGFNRARFESFLRELLNRFEPKPLRYQGAYIPDAFKDHVASLERIGTYVAPGGERVDLLVVQLAKHATLARARTALRNYVAHHLKRRGEKDAALVAFVSPSEPSWRFSYVRMEYATRIDDGGRVGVETQLTPARRLSYLVGEGESCHTAQSRFLEILQRTSHDPTIEELEAAFSVEAVTKEFFEQYKALFLNLKDQLDALAKRDKSVAREFTARKVDTVDFAKKLMGQIVFLYFLQKKGWLGVAKGQAWGTGPRDFIRRLTSGDFGVRGNIFNDILEPLFYDTLATDRGQEAWCPRFKCRIPFLNGGLFEPLCGYDWVATDIILPDDTFTNEEKTSSGDFGTGILDVFDRFNFTVNEAEPLEIEVAIDPEMLGKVFENLLEVRERKSKGSFYTPREIVHYMCQESLISYLEDRVNREAGTVARGDIEALIRAGEQAAHYEAARIDGSVSYERRLPASVERCARSLDDALSAITVCDPAIGSGAFPVGMMTEIVRARTTLTPYLEEDAERTPYHFKRHAIQACLYGVDIDPGAVEIAKLRLWLSLVVDEEDVKQIKPLPNLDYKVVSGNSLLGVEKTLFNEDLFRRLEELKPLYFDASDRAKKAGFKREIDELIHEVTNGKEVFDFDVYFSEVMNASGRGGFDVVIGNPPYVRADVDPQHTRMRKTILSSGHYETLWEKWDLYVAFIERGYKLLRPGGVTTLIVSDAFCHSKYAQKSQAWFLTHARILRLDFCSDLKFFDASVHNLIYFFQRAEGASWTPERRLHRVTFGDFRRLPSETQANLTYRVFFPEGATRQTFSTQTVRLGGICYISVGMVINADERSAKGAFLTDELISRVRDKLHPKAFVEGKNLTKWCFSGHSWLEWGTERAPHQFRRQTFPELYEHASKLMLPMVGEIRGAIDSERFYCNHGIFVCVPWHQLQGVRNRSLKKVARYRGERPPRADLPMREELEAKSRGFDLKYLLGVINSTPAREFLRANRRNNLQLYPDDWKKLPIPDVTAEKQAPVVKVVEGILAAKRLDTDSNVSEAEAHLEELVCELYGANSIEAAPEA